MPAIENVLGTLLSLAETQENRFAIAEAGASVRDIRHERAFGGPDVSTVHVDCTLEVRDRAHGEAVLASLDAAKIPLRRVGAAIQL